MPAEAQRLRGNCHVAGGGLQCLRDQAGLEGRGCGVVVLCGHGWQVRMRGGGRDGVTRDHRSHRGRRHVPQDALRKMRDADAVAVFQQTDAFQQVFKLAHVAGPLVGLENAPDVVVEITHPALVLGVVFDEAVFSQEKDVVSPLAQGRNIDRDHLQAVVQVVTEVAGLDLAQKDLVGRRNKAHIHVDGAHCAHPPETAGVEQGQHLGLHHRIEFAHFVQKDRAAIGRFNQSFLLADRAREGAPLVSEEFGLQQLGRDGCAVDVHEFGLGAVGLLVDHAGHQPLAGPGFAIDQDRVRLAARHTGDQLAQRDDGRMFSNQRQGGRRGCHLEVAQEKGLGQAGWRVSILLELAEPAWISCSRLVRRKKKASRSGRLLMQRRRITSCGQQSRLRPS